LAASIINKLNPDFLHLRSYFAAHLKLTAGFVPISNKISPFYRNRLTWLDEFVCPGASANAANGEPDQEYGRCI